MADRLPSDHASVRTERAAVTRSGGTRRPCLELPDALALDSGDLVRLVLDGDEYHARIQADRSGLLLRGAYDLRSEAKDPGRAENRLVGWLQTNDREPDDALDLDVLEPGERYGLRLPGERVVYTEMSSPSSSLQDIATDLDG
ncbi:MAG: hypothetical protein V5A38_09800 [Halolamina sp.]|uniref:DUF7112 family protein n=1 Tax=Halolamina sp. TaxID=1940283 RepID=UPI002FC348D6